VGSANTRSPSHPDRLDIPNIPATTTFKSQVRKDRAAQDLRKFPEHPQITKSEGSLEGQKSLQVSQASLFNEPSNLYQLVEAGVFPISAVQRSVAVNSRPSS